MFRRHDPDGIVGGGRAVGRVALRPRNRVDVEIVRPVPAAGADDVRGGLGERNGVGFFGQVAACRLVEFGGRGGVELALLEAGDAGDGLGQLAGDDRQRGAKIRGDPHEKVEGVGGGLGNLELVARTPGDAHDGAVEDADAVGALVDGGKRQIIAWRKVGLWRRQPEAYLAVGGADDAAGGDDVGVGGGVEHLPHGNAAGRDLDGAAGRTGQDGVADAFAGVPRHAVGRGNVADLDDAAKLAHVEILGGGRLAGRQAGQNGSGCSVFHGGPHSSLSITSMALRRATFPDDFGASAITSSGLACTTSTESTQALNAAPAAVSTE